MRKRVIERIESLWIQGRNATTWDDDRRAAASSRRGRGRAKLAKNVAGVARSAAPGPGPGEKFLTAMAMHEALKLYGMRYVVDPSTPYVELSKKEEGSTFCSSLAESLEFKAGDLRRPSILYSALLEAVGIETASSRRSDTSTWPSPSSRGRNEAWKSFRGPTT